MTASTTTANTTHHPLQMHAACLFDIVDTSLLPPPAESYALDIGDATVQRLVIVTSIVTTCFALAGLVLAASTG